MKKRILMVGGKFDDNGGRPSSYFGRLMVDMHCYDMMITLINGGRFETLQNIISNAKPFDFVVWMADVPNDKPKLLGQIKTRWPKCILVISKRNDEGKYAMIDLAYRALNAKANLLVEFVKKEGLISASVYDPLGNIFGSEFGVHYDTTAELAGVLNKRMRILATMTRQESICDGPELPVQDKPEFFNLVREYAEVYHTLIHGANPSRMLGNVSFRCEKGFPSFRSGEVVYISKRNMDKRMIGVEGFVAVDLDSTDSVRYCGDAKPSVDAPIQTALYRNLPWVNYMLHSHVYIKDAPFTKSVIPCGAMQELEEIMALWDSFEKYEKNVFHKDGKTSRVVMINLLGHGSLVMTDNLEGMKDIPYMARNCPEVQKV